MEEGSKSSAAECIAEKYTSNVYSHLNHSTGTVHATVHATSTTHTTTNTNGTANDDGMGVGNIGRKSLPTMPPSNRNNGDRNRVPQPTPGTMPGGDFADDLLPSGIPLPGFAQPDRGGGGSRTGNLMGPNHPSFHPQQGDDYGSGYYEDGSDFITPGGLGMQPRFDPFYPPGVGGFGPGRGRGRGGRGGLGRGRGRGRFGGGDPNPDHMRPPNNFNGGDMFM